MQSSKLEKNGFSREWSRDTVCSLEGSVLNGQAAKSRGSRKQVSKSI